MGASVFPIRVQSSGGNQNGFALNTPQVINNNTVTFSFEENQPAGRYTIQASNNNYNYDMYLVSESGESVGYSNTNTIVATGTFNRLVIYNATVSTSYGFTYKLLGLELPNGTIESGTAPFLVSATPTTLPNRDSTTTVTGGNFATDVRAFFVNSSSVATEAKSVVRNSSTEIVVTRPDAMPISEGPWSLRVVNDSVPAPIRGANVLSNYLDSGQTVQWVTQLLANYTANPYSFALEATDPEGSNVTYEIIAGSLPEGFSLSESGVISGTTTGTESFSSFTVRAFDGGGNFADRAFTLSRPIVLTVITTSGTVNIAKNDTPFLISGGGGAGGNGFFTTGGWRGGGSGYITTGTVNIGNYSLSVGAGGIGVGYDQQPGNGGTTTFGSFSAAGGTNGRNGGAGGSAGGNAVGTQQADAVNATGFTNGAGSGGSGITVPQPWDSYTLPGQLLEMQGGVLVWTSTNSRPGASGGKFYSGGGGTKATDNYFLQAATNTAGGVGNYGGGGGAGGGGASNNPTGPGDGISGNGGTGFLATLRQD